jgi:hypothetical protein
VPYAATMLYDGHWGNAILSWCPITLTGVQKIYNRGVLAPSES